MVGRYDRLSRFSGLSYFKTAGRSQVSDDLKVSEEFKHSLDAPSMDVDGFIARFDGLIQDIR